jgi:hypothetical protein
MYLFRGLPDGLLARHQPLSRRKNIFSAVSQPSAVSAAPKKKRLSTRLNTKWHKIAKDGLVWLSFSLLLRRPPNDISRQPPVTPCIY